MDLFAIGYLDEGALGNGVGSQNLSLLAAPDDDLRVQLTLVLEDDSTIQVGYWILLDLESSAFDDVLVVHDSLNIGENRLGVRVPVVQYRAFLDRSSVPNMKHCAQLHFMGVEFLAILVDDGHRRPATEDYFITGLAGDMSCFTQFDHASSSSFDGRFLH